LTTLPFLQPVILRTRCGYKLAGCASLALEVAVFVGSVVDGKTVDFTVTRGLALPGGGTEHLLSLEITTRTFFLGTDAVQILVFEFAPVYLGATTTPRHFDRLIGTQSRVGNGQDQESNGSSFFL